MRSDWLEPQSMGLVLAAMMPKNRLALDVSICTGLRISDVLGLKTNQLKQRMTVQDMKTKKRHRVYFPLPVFLEMKKVAGEHYVFENRLNDLRPRTRQAVYKDLKKCAEFLKRNGLVPRLSQISPHSARKIAAVGTFRRTGDMLAVGRLLNHSTKDLGVTSLYATSDFTTAKKVKKGKKQ